MSHRRIPWLTNQYNNIIGYINNKANNMQLYSETLRFIDSVVSTRKKKDALKKFSMLYDCLIEKLVIQKMTSEEIYKYMENTETPLCLLQYLIDENYKPEEDNYGEHYIDEDNYFDKKFTFRQNQLTAIDNTINQGFMCGIHEQIMGAGKTYIMLKLVSEHYKKYNKNKTYIICTYMKEILDKTFYTNGKIDKTKITFWRNNNIIDIDKFNFVDYVNSKPKKLSVKNNDKPNLMIINNTFLVCRYKNSKEIFNNVAFISVDECHSVSANNFYGILCDIKYIHKIPIIGFSATPLRDNAETKVINIFSESIDKNIDILNRKLNIISSYNYVDALNDGIVLPFTYHYIEIKNNNEKSKDKDNRAIVESFKIIIDRLYYKKVIAWASTIEDAIKWYNTFLSVFVGYTIFRVTSDNNAKSNRDILDQFYGLENKGLLICVNMCKEGSDFPNVDCGIYLDAVIKRSILVRMQSSGRIIRPDIGGHKTRAVIIDTFITRDGSCAELMTIQKLYEYYKKVWSMTRNKTAINKITDMYKLYNNIKLDKNTSNIIVKLNDNDDDSTVLNFQLINRTLDWSFVMEGLKNKVNDYIKKELSVNDIDILKCEYNKWVDYNKRCRIISKQIYEKHTKRNNNMIKDPVIYFGKIWKNWYDYLGLDVSMYPTNTSDLIKIIEELDIRTVEQYYNSCEYCNLPSMPEELYIGFTFNDLFSNKKKLKITV